MSLGLPPRTVARTGCQAALRTDRRRNSRRQPRRWRIRQPGGQSHHLRRFPRQLLWRRRDGGAAFAARSLKPALRNPSTVSTVDQQRSSILGAQTKGNWILKSSSTGKYYKYVVKSAPLQGGLRPCMTQMTAMVAAAARAPWRRPLDRGPWSRLARRRGTTTWDYRQLLDATMGQYTYFSLLYRY